MTRDVHLISTVRVVRVNVLCCVGWSIFILRVVFFISTTGPINKPDKITLTF